MLKVINNKGFQMTFINGWTVSVMYGRGNYCENNYAQIPYPHEANPKAEVSSKTAEVWAWKDGTDLPKDPIGWQTPAEVAEFINAVANRCHCGHSAEAQRSDHCSYCGCEEHERRCDQIMPEGFDVTPD